ncbi:MAG: DUF3656 domain-containing protein [Defluviitaleaceae bacterium]|nr:DUF3656 domain-containing protein [Defluviitaleaceae bacterium]
MTELLSPAGDMDSAKAAINAGADAIYLGGKSYSARGFAKNFTEEEIENLTDYAALRGVKIYVTLNTLYSNEELPQVLSFAREVYRMGVSAFILQDIGLAELIKNNLPDIRLHASTQMTVHSAEGVGFMAKAGFSRVVLSRELSLAEISQITQAHKDVETEVFVHGALCVSYSGQCLLSGMVGGRSGNRGKCAQPCRLVYDFLEDGEVIKSGHLLSTKDMMTLDMLDEITKTGVTALKIEGRMKSPEYVHVVTKAYRDQLDHAKIDKRVINDVTQVFNRGGSFSTGYFKTYGGATMMSTETPKSTGVFCGTVTKYKKGKCSIRFAKEMLAGDGIEIWTNKGANVGTGISKLMKPNDTAVISIEGNIEVGNDVYKSYDKRLIDETKKALSADTPKTSIIGSVEAKLGKPVKLAAAAQPLFAEDMHSKLHARLEASKIIVEACSQSVVEEAKNAPLGKDELIAQLSKMGNSPFAITFENVNVDENIFVSKLALNEVRRDVVKSLEEMILTSKTRLAPEDLIIPKQSIASAQAQKLTVQIMDIRHLNAVLEHDISRVYVDMKQVTTEILDKLPESRAEIFLAMPSVSRNADEEALKTRVRELEDANFDGYLVATYGQLNILRDFLKTKKKIMLDYNFNVFNNSSARAFGDAGVTLSQELTAKQLKRMPSENCEIIVYGRQILMSTHNCPVGLYGADKNGKFCSERFSRADYVLLDRKDIKFPVITDCENCITHILNSKTLDTAARFKEIKDTGIEYLRLLFTDETDEAITDTILRYQKHLHGSAENYKGENKNYTFGHFFRGVE